MNKKQFINKYNTILTWPKKKTLKTEISELCYGPHTMTEDKNRKKLVSEILKGNSLAVEFAVSLQTTPIFTVTKQFTTFPSPGKKKHPSPSAPKSSFYYEFTEVISPRTGRWPSWDLLSCYLSSIRTHCC